jgi:hypothetical protein
MLHKPIRFKESPETRGNAPCRARDPRLCGNRIICGSMTLILPPLHIFKVLLARGSGTDMEPPTEYWRSRFQPSQADKISHSPETRENARAPVRDPPFCGYRQRSASFAATCVSGRSCPRPLYCKVRFCLGRTWNGRHDAKRLCTGSTFNNSTLCPHCVFMCFVWISEQTGIISLYWSVFTTATDSVYCAVRISS